MYLFLYVLFGVEADISHIARFGGLCSRIQYRLADVRERLGEYGKIREIPAAILAGIYEQWKGIRKIFEKGVIFGIRVALYYGFR